MKPINEKSFAEIINNHKHIISIENHNVIGGLGSILSDIIATKGLNAQLTKLGVQDTFAEGAETDYLFKKYEISSEAIIKIYKNLKKK